ncbi:T9SS C-terminal target domain-containing protein [Chryseobacterium nematophagum]|uniref:T9SS C-terminal target domain-containing protein n=1 Tax=Chryseobacterium nematophagum TaxID=2305228 RepID=A0A3M7TDE2_9FLAO|nr:M36 family metallopeptidase [Chryseobacterium nematophagum]RNA61064.1 T9SS C-terminal target domain-containing protein [Chryseobacterium nematophagum]
MKKNYSAFIAALFLCSSMSFAQDNETILNRYLRSTSSQFKKSDLLNYSIENKDYSVSLKGDIIKVQQTYNGLPVFNAVSTVLIKDNKIAYFSDSFEKDYKRADYPIPKLDFQKAFEKMSQEIQLKNSSEYKLQAFHLKNHDKKSLVSHYRTVYLKDQNDLILCYEFLFSEKENLNLWDILVNAETGKIVRKSNLTVHCGLSPDQYKSDNNGLLFPQNKAFYNSKIKDFSTSFSRNTHESKIRKEGSNLDLSKNTILVDNASYNVFAIPIESPNFGNRNVMTNPWVLSSSPEGWHSDGTIHYTDTRGNNIEAGLINDSDEDLVPVDGGSARNFNFPYDENTSPDYNLNSAIANLFYTTNRVHDILYQFGFTETARNYQKNNFGKGGVGNDQVKVNLVPVPANNAFFVPPPDGESGEMVIFLWDQPLYLQYNTPTEAQSRKPNALVTPFSLPLPSGAGFTGNVISIIDGCMPLSAGSLTNSIGLVESSNCSDLVKLKNIQEAGALAAIIYEAPGSSDITPVSGNDPTIFMPSVKILNSEGEYIKNLLDIGTTVNISLKNDPSSSKTSNVGFDNGIVTHEYVHGLSNRLTGDGYSCLDKNVSAEQMGEGWSDFYSMILTNRPEYTASTSRGSGTYVLNETPTGPGIRPAKYSIDFSINNYTYGRTNGMKFSNGDIDEHSIGFVWATMLWDLHWKYAEKYGYSADVLANMTNGSTKVLQLVTDALKLQVCNPSFVEGRDAILAAEQAVTGGEDKCMIWKVFAKRGLGVNASAGNKANINDQIEDFTVPTECNILSTEEIKAVKNTILIYPNPVKNEFFIEFPSKATGRFDVEVYDMSGKLVLSEGRVFPSVKKPISTDTLSNGVYVVRVKGLGFDSQSKIMVKK